MRVLISGKNSQMGQTLFSMDKELSHDLKFLDSKSMDLKDLDCINSTISSYDPDIVINFSAYTDVDEAEDNLNEVNLINSIAPKYLARASKQANAFFIQISTDYVFGEFDNPPFSSLSKTGPLNSYGLSKLKGEENSLEENDKSIIIRTSSLYSEFGNNFVKNIAKKLINKEDLKIISDQKISMTYADDFINALIAILDEKKLKNIVLPKLPLILHYSSDGFTTWYNVANEIIKNLNQYFDKLGTITPITYLEWSSKATRPKDSRLSIDYSLLSSLDIKLNPWELGVKEVLKKLYS